MVSIDDARQEADIRAWELSDKPAGYQARAAYRRQIEILRASTRELKKLADLDDELSGGDDPAAIVGAALEEQDEARRLALACARVGETARRVAGCARMGLSAKETADMLDCSLPRVYQCYGELRRAYEAVQ